MFKRSLKYLKKYNTFALILVKVILKKNFPQNNNILRYYGIGAQIIKDLKINKMILVSRTKNV